MALVKHLHTTLESSPIGEIYTALMDGGVNVEPNNDGNYPLAVAAFDYDPSFRILGREVWISVYSSGALTVWEHGTNNPPLAEVNIHDDPIRFAALLAQFLTTAIH